MSKSLAKIIIDVPIDFNENDLEKKEPDEMALESLLQELEFKSLSRRLLKREIELKKPKDSIKEPSKPIQASQKIGQMDLFSAENSPALKPQEKPVQKNDYVIIDSLPSAKLLRNKLLQQDSFCFSTQVVKSEVGRNYLSGIAFSYAPNRAYYVPLGNASDEDHTDLLEFLKSPLEEN